MAVRLFTMTALALLVATAFTGCSSDSSDVAKAQAEAEKAKAEAEKAKAEAEKAKADPNDKGKVAKQRRTGRIRCDDPVVISSSKEPLIIIALEPEDGRELSDTKIRVELNEILSKKMRDTRVALEEEEMERRSRLGSRERKLEDERRLEEVKREMMRVGEKQPEVLVEKTKSVFNKSGPRNFSKEYDFKNNERQINLLDLIPKSFLPKLIGEYRMTITTVQFATDADVRAINEGKEPKTPYYHFPEKLVTLRIEK
jgi:hypothetical protein